MWRNHSHSIVCMGLGCLVVAISIPLREGTMFDLVSQLGGGLMGAAIVNFLAGPLKEINRPDK